MIDILQITIRFCLKRKKSRTIKPKFNNWNHEEESSVNILLISVLEKTGKQCKSENMAIEFMLTYLFTPIFTQNGP